MDPYLYKVIYLQCSLALVLITFFVYSRTAESPSLVLGYNKFLVLGVTAVLILFIGTRPISGAFVDMVTYSEAYFILQSREFVSFKDDWAFSGMMQIIASGFSVETFFLICATLYILPLAVASQISHKNWSGSALLCMAGAFSFFTYGVNGIRQGIATSLVILGIALGKKRFWAALVLTLATGMHKSVWAIVCAYLLAAVVTIPWVYGVVWFICLIISFYYGEGISAIILGLLPGTDDNRIENYAYGQGGDKGGFRADFILYSIIPIILSYVMGDEKIRKEIFYRRLLSTYLIVNAFWLLSMYAAFSNRFAYLSWCLLPWLLIYPFIPNYNFTGSKVNAMPSNPTKVGLVLCAHFSFTYIMFQFVYN